MAPDNEGFPHPVVDAERCTGCRLCETACPVLHRHDAREPLAVYAALCRDQAVRMASSSGGIFTLLARQVLAAGGTVYGAGWNKTLQVTHKAARNEAELADLRGSKYVQSAMGATLHEAKADLEQGRKVLFSGTPCQIAGLRAFLRRDFPNLLCVDLICHGVPSPEVWGAYVRELETRHKAKAVRAFFRNKNIGWKEFALAVTFADSAEYLGSLHHDPFLRGFLADLYNRPACHQCLFRELRSGADLTLADYWNVAARFPDLDDNQGTSLVLASTQRGAEAFAQLAPQLVSRESDYADARRRNPYLFRSPVAHPKREKFFRNLKRSSVATRIERLTRPSSRRRLRNWLGRRWRAFEKRMAR